MSDDSLRIDGNEVSVEPVKPLSGGGARVDVETDDGRRWRVDVRSTGELKDVVTTWQDETLTDLDVPDWMDEVLVRLTTAV